jgi:protein-disulfide isomerase
MKKTIFALSGLLTVGLFAGCMNEEGKELVSGLSEEKIKTLISEEIKKNSTEKTSIQLSNTTPLDYSLSEEDFKSAFTTYLENNPDDFGQKLDIAYNKYQKNKNETSEKDRLEKVKNVKNIQPTDHVLGDKNAKFVLFEYSDYHCPFCKKFHPTTKTFLDKNKDVALVLRPYPLVHKDSATPLHEIAECTAKESGNDAFWKISDVIFDKGSALSDKNIEKEFEKLQIKNIDKIMKCYKDGTFKDLVENTEKEARSLGINGTPGSILKNMETGEVRFIGGAYPLETLENYKKELTK